MGLEASEGEGIGGAEGMYGLRGVVRVRGLRGVVRMRGLRGVVGLRWVMKLRVVMNVRKANKDANHR